MDLNGSRNLTQSFSLLKVWDCRGYPFFSPILPALPYQAMSPTGIRSFSRNCRNRILSLLAYYIFLLLLHHLNLHSIWFVRCVITRHDNFDPQSRVGSSFVCHPRLSLHFTPHLLLTRHDTSHSYWFYLSFTPLYSTKFYFLPLCLSTARVYARHFQQSSKWCALCSCPLYFLYLSVCPTVEAFLAYNRKAHAVS